MKARWEKELTYRKYKVISLRRGTHWKHLSVKKLVFQDLIEMSSALLLMPIEIEVETMLRSKV